MFVQRPGNHTIGETAVVKYRAYFIHKCYNWKIWDTNMCLTVKNIKSQTVLKHITKAKHEQLNKNQCGGPFITTIHNSKVGRKKMKRK